MPVKRYKNSTTKKLGKQGLRGEGTQVYRSLIPTKIDPATDDLIYIADEGERLDYLAHRFYGASSYWYILASVNNLTNGSVHIPPGMELRIPSKNRVI